MSITVILPKHPSITSVYVADTMESDEDLNEFSRICEQSLTWNGKDSQSRTWLRRLKRMKWMRLLFSRTSRPSHTTSFVDAWTCFLRDSHANPFPVVESANQPKTQDTCTRGSQMELPLADQGLCCLRTSKESSRQRQETENPYLNMFLETWKKEVTERRGAWLARTKSERPTEGSESSSGYATSERSCRGSEDEGGQQSEVLGSRPQSDADVPDDTSAGTCSNDQGVRQGTSGTSRRQGTDRPRFPARPNERQFEWEEPRTFVAELDGATDGRTCRVDPVANRTHRLRLLGNGVVPATCERAVRILWNDLHGSARA